MPGRVSIKWKGSQEKQACLVGGTARIPRHLVEWSEVRVEEMNLETLPRVTLSGMHGYGGTLKSFTQNSDMICLMSLREHSEQGEKIGF